MSYYVLSFNKLSASSRIKNSHSSNKFFLFVNRSLSLPAVHIAKWTLSSSSFWRSSLTDRPPINDYVLIFLNLLNLLAIYRTWWASYLVLTITMACTRFDLGLISFKMGIRYAAVFPVPFLALAMIDLRFLIKGIDYSWIGVGLLKPHDAKAKRIFSSKFN